MTIEEFSSVPLLTKNNSMTSRHHSIKAKTLDTLAEIFSDEKDGNKLESLYDTHIIETFLLIEVSFVEGTRKLSVLYKCHIVLHVHVSCIGSQ